MKEFNHIPVLPKETIDLLNIQHGNNQRNIYVDGTLGGGGHSSLILKQLQETDQLIGIDRDADALAAATNYLKSDKVSSKFQAIQGNFHDMPELLRQLDIHQVNGILLDLGVSSYQLDTAHRGFSYRMDGPLDMRMDKKSTTLTAKEIVNIYSEKEIADLLFTYGEERNSRRLARAICATRKIEPIETTLQLANIIAKVNRHKYGEPHPAMRSFMALRIAVNDELNPLASVLENLVSLLAPTGRIAVITFHSLEDRIVKTTFQKLASPCTCPRDIPYCVCGKLPQVKVITRKPVIPSKEELSTNSRASSAKLRVAEKLEVHKKLK